MYRVFEPFEDNAACPRVAANMGRTNSPITQLIP